MPTKRLVVWVGLLLLLSTGAGAATPPSWIIERVDRTSNGDRKPAIRATADGRLHLVYTGCSDAPCKNDELFYGVREKDGKWALSSVDATQGATGWFPSMEIDSTGTIHIVYGSHFKNPTLQYAFLKPGRTEWQKQTVGRVPGGYWTSTAIFGDRLFVSNTTFPSSNINKPALQFASSPLEGAADAWTFQMLDDSADAGWLTSMVVTPDGQPLIAYLAGGYPKGDLILQSRSADGSWHRERIDGEVVKNSLAVDSKGFLHVAYTREDNDYMEKMDLYYATNAPSGVWKSSKIDGGQQPQSDTGYHPHLTLDSRDGVHIVYTDDYHIRVMYARNLGDGWEVSQITQNRDYGFYAWGEVDLDGALHVVYDKGNQLMVAHCKDCAVR